MSFAVTETEARRVQRAEDRAGIRRAVARSASCEFDGGHHVPAVAVQFDELDNDFRVVCWRHARDAMLIARLLDVLAVSD